MLLFTQNEVKQILSAEEKNWNKEFQELLELPPTPDKYTQIRHLSQEFLDIGTESFFFCLILVLSYHVR